MGLRDMVAGRRYNTSDGYGYDEVLCLGCPTDQEIIDHYCEINDGCYVKVQYDNGATDIWFTANGQSAYDVYAEEIPL